MIHWEVVVLFVVIISMSLLARVGKEKYADIHYQSVSPYGTLNHYNSMIAPDWYKYFPTFPWWWIPGGNYHELY